MFPMRTLSFQVSQPIKSSKNMSVNIDIIKHFLGKIGERYNLKKKADSQHENITSSKSSVNEVMEAVKAGENDSSTQGPFHKVTDEDDLMKLFYQFSRLMSSM